MTLRYLKIFLAVADQESITKAAEKLYIAQPSVSIAIKELEAYYGVRLFERFNRRIQITEEGRRFESYARYIVQLFDELERSLKNTDETGILRVGASTTVGTCYIARYIEMFQQHSPNITVKVRIAPSDVIEQMLLDNNLDLAVTEGFSHSQYIFTQKITEDRLIPICAPNHPFAEMNHPVSLEEFMKQPLLLREKRSGSRELFENALALQGCSVQPIWESDSAEAILQGVHKNLGVSVLPQKLVEQQIAVGYVAPFFVGGLQINHMIHIVYHKNKYMSNAMKSFIEVVKKGAEEFALSENLS